MTIQSFKCEQTRQLFEGSRVARWVNIQTVAMRKLAMLNAAVVLGDLRIPPQNRLEALAGDRKGQHSIRINDQWRACFKWTAAGPIEVEIVDYH
ncbi:type II toxin-antitoxin system RelE/ParE family toxin [Variovorax sp.]|uniref:type II toxin-antitoxin system RelE/ParE family toxin n=1 Tax=Variovorax sp. TaxID=1871043 RepID=UPI003BAAA16F